MTRWRAVFLALPLIAPLIAAAPAGRQSLGVSGSWGAFRDARPARCFAIAEAGYSAISKDQRWRPFMSVADWPGARIGNQLHVRLARRAQPGKPVELRVGGRRFALVVAGADAWAADATADAAIIGALRVGQWAVITGKGENGETIRDAYKLAGAATAIDAAMLACAK